MTRYKVVSGLLFSIALIVSIGLNEANGKPQELQVQVPTTSLWLFPLIPEMVPVFEPQTISSVFDTLAWADSTPTTDFSQNEKPIVQNSPALE